MGQMLCANSKTEPSDSPGVQVQNTDDSQPVTHKEKETPLDVAIQSIDQLSITTDENQSNHVDSTISEDPYLSFPFLIDPQSIKWYKKNRIMLVMRGLSGSGKSTIVQAIQKTFPQAVVCSADHFFIDDVNGEYKFDANLLKDAHESCQKRARSALENSETMVVIDNTNVQKWEMNFYFSLAKANKYIVVLVEPMTPWKLDPTQLAFRNSHGVSEEVLRRKVGQFKDIIPTYFALFVNVDTSLLVLETAKSILASCLQSCLDFEANFASFSSMINLRSMLGFYTRDECLPSNKKMVHCTMKFCGKDGGSAYIRKPVVQNSLGKVFPITVIGLVFTPRTFGARVLLTEEELEIYNQDDSESNPNPLPKRRKPKSSKKRGSKTNLKDQISTDCDAIVPKILPTRILTQDNPYIPIPGRGRRAHITLGTSDGVPPVTTGFDVLEVVQREKEAFESSLSVPTFDTAFGKLRNLDDELWVLYFDRAWEIDSIFTGSY